MTCAHSCSQFATDFVLYYSHACDSPAACSFGETLLQWAIGNWQRRGVVALLRSVSAAE
jgi:hypothetical protein